MDLLIQEQFKKLMESQAEQIKLLQSIIREESKNGKHKEGPKDNKQ
jgi:hypothetical protein